MQIDGIQKDDIVGARPPFFLWLTDEWSALDHRLDTSLRLMQEATRRGIRSVWCEARGINIVGETLRISGHLVESVEELSHEGFRFRPAQHWSLDDFDSVQIRMNPPADLRYLQTLQLLEFGARRQNHPSRPDKFVNPLSVLLASTSKLDPLHIPGACPDTIVGRDRKALARFGEEHGLTILKPLNSFDRRGVETLDWRSQQTRAYAEDRISERSHHFSEAVVLQAICPQSPEIRAWYVDGNLIGYGSRETRKEEDTTGEALLPVVLDSESQKLACAIGDHLAARGIRLAAADIIGSRLIDLNFASPGLLIELESLLRENLAGRIIAALVGTGRTL